MATNRVIEMIRNALGLAPSERPHMSPEQVLVAKRLDRNADRLRVIASSIDVEAEVLRTDAKRRP